MMKTPEVRGFRERALLKVSISLAICPENNSPRVQSAMTLWPAHLEGCWSWASARCGAPASERLRGETSRSNG